MAIKDDPKGNSIEKLTAWMNNLEGAPLDELRRLRMELGHDVEGSEQIFLAHIQKMNSELGSTEQAFQDVQSPPAPESSLRGLLSEARARGLSNLQFANQTNLSIALVTKLDLRLIRFASIPNQVIEDLANALDCIAERVKAYLQGNPLLPADAYFKADEAPTVPEQQDFFEEVRADTSLSEERRRRLLAMET